MGCCGCIANCIAGFYKYLVFLFNLVFVIAGIAILTLGILIEIKILDLSDYASIDFHTSAIVLMVSGGFIVVVSFFGCCGAITDNRCLLNLYATLLLVSFALQLAGAVLVFASGATFSVNLKDEMMKMMNDYPPPQFEGETGVVAQRFWDTTQEVFSCCGIRSRLDWSIYNPNLPSVPDSCKCADPISWECDAEGYYTTGCYYDVMSTVILALYIMAWVAIGVAGIQLFFGILTLIYANSGGRRGKHTI